MRACISILGWLLVASTVQAQQRAQDVEVADPFGYLEPDVNYGDEGSDEGQPEKRMAKKDIPATHTVKKGDTLWDITGLYYGNPWEWPRVWSFNPEVTNPHWIYPDHVLRLRADGAEALQVVTLPSGKQVVVRNKRPEGDIYLRREGFIEKGVLAHAGTLVAADEETMMLTTYDQVYLRFKHPEKLKKDSEYTIFHAVNDEDRVVGEEGQLVRIYGTVKVNAYDPQSKIATGTITEALDPIERGYLVAPLIRRFSEVAPVTNQSDVEAKIVATLRPRELLGDGRVVFVNKGRKDGVAVGNRFLVIRQGDTWQKELHGKPREIGATVDLPEQPERYPEETVAELRVVDVQKSTAACMITSSRREVNIGDRAEMPRGY